MKTNELETFSWDIVNGEYCTKRMDKSFFTYGESVIPIGIRSYFDIANNSYGDKIDINILFKGKEYNSIISFENNFNRSKLRICKELHKELTDNLKVLPLKDDNYNSVILIFIKDRTQKFKLELIYQV